MSKALETAQKPTDQVAVLMAVNARQQEEISRLKRQLEWFRRHLFGQKSERRNPAYTASNWPSVTWVGKAILRLLPRTPSLPAHCQ
ncbi:MAG: transposase [Ferrovum myxofaciens]